MHTFNAVVLPPDTDLEKLDYVVDQAMAPHEEKYDEQTDDLSGFWDWFQIGGRWTGVWSEYDPSKDPRNVETCRVCGGTGLRPDWERFGEAWRENCGGCNGCRGKGSEVKWPTNWERFEGDVIPVKVLLNNPVMTPARLVLPDGSVFEYEGWDAPDDWYLQVVEALTPYSNHLLVVVDSHS